MNIQTLGQWYLLNQIMMEKFWLILIVIETVKHVEELKVIEDEDDVEVKEYANFTDLIEQKITPV